MANFDSAVSFMLPNEGGLVDNPADPGGITNFGISLRFLKNLSPERLKRYGIFNEPTTVTIRSLTVDQAKLIYRGEFWEALPFEKIQNQILCNIIFDTCVNVGLTQGTKIAQRAVWAAMKLRNAIKDDGVMGSKTIQAINQCSFMLLPCLLAVRAGFYRLLAEKNPANKEFLNGWLDRAYRY